MSGRYTPKKTQRQRLLDLLAPYKYREATQEQVLNEILRMEAELMEVV